MNAYELLEKLYAVLGDLQPMLTKQDDSGNYMHQNIEIKSMPLDHLQKLVDELEAYVSAE